LDGTWYLYMRSPGGNETERFRLEARPRTAAAKSGVIRYIQPGVGERGDRLTIKGNSFEFTRKAMMLSCK